MAIFNLKEIKREAKEEILEAKDLRDLDKIFKKFLGKKGKLREISKKLKELSQKERKKIGMEINLVKKELEKLIEKKKSELKKEYLETKEKKIDITVPGKKIEKGHLHPITQVRRKVEEIFQSMGFSLVEGPEIENEWYNFDALNIPKDHPARDLWDTFWLKEDKLLLRTHTTPVDVRYLEKNNPPLRIIIPGRIFRHEATDASHEINFYQIDGLMIDKDISIADFKGIIKKFFILFFNKEISIRLRPSFFPFTEPSFEVDVLCVNCKGKGCSVCSQTGWVEMMGAGMIHPNVLKNAKLNPKFWQGFAFGMGLDRLTMMKFKITDIRLFYSGDLRFLKQF